MTALLAPPSASPRSARGSPHSAAGPTPPLHRLQPRRHGELPHRPRRRCRDPALARERTWLPASRRPADPPPAPGPACRQRRFQGAAGGRTGRRLCAALASSIVTPYFSRICAVWRSSQRRRLRWDRRLRAATSPAWDLGGGPRQRLHPPRNAVEGSPQRVFLALPHRASAPAAERSFTRRLPAGLGPDDGGTSAFPHRPPDVVDFNGRCWLSSAWRRVISSGTWSASGRAVADGNAEIEGHRVVRGNSAGTAGRARGRSRRDVKKRVGRVAGLPGGSSASRLPATSVRCSAASR